MSSGTLGFVGFILSRIGVVLFIRVLSDASFGSFGRALGVVGFIRVRVVLSSTTWRSSDSFRFVRFICALPWGS